jgi:LysM repeat protein
MLDRIAQIVLTITGALVLALLVLGLAISCRPLAAGDPAGETATASAATAMAATMMAVTPGSPTPFVPSPTPSSNPTPIPPIGSGPSPTPTPSPTGQSGGGGPTDPNATAGATDPATGGTVPTPAATQPGGSGGQAGPLTPGSTVSHTVIRGEWLIQISRCYGVTYESLAAANPRANPHLIYPGETLTIPNIGSVGRIIGPPCVVAYTVAAGDTWESLAQRFATTTAILQRANPGPLSVGRSIWAPRAP